MDRPDASVALLRGINVGGKNRVAMKDLVGLFLAAGCEDVTTYIQSGNVIFRASPTLLARLPALLTKRIESDFGMRIPVVLRTAGELRDVARLNPFLDVGGPTEALHVALLADLPSPQSVAALDPNRSPPDQFRVVGREIYLRLPNGVARTKLTNAWFDSRLATVSTLRNWRTLLELIERTAD